jgi:GNAT superfamily N-acetyltransferase
MKTDSEFVQAANRNYVGAYRTLIRHTGGEVRFFGGVFAFTTGIPLSIFNGCVVVEPSVGQDIGAGIRWAQSLGLPFQVVADGPWSSGVEPIAVQHGLEPDADPEPVMVMHPLPRLPAPAPAITVLEASIREFRDVSVATGIPREFAARLYTDSFASDPDVRLFVARTDGRTVSKSIAIRTGDVAGVYDVATIPEARRRGAGAAVTWAALGAARDWGCESAVLQASPMGYPVYRAMGFRTVASYTMFRLPR